MKKFGVYILLILLLTLTACQWRELRVEATVLGTSFNDANIATLEIEPSKITFTDQPITTTDFGSYLEIVLGTTANPEVNDIKVGDKIALICLESPWLLFKEESCRLVSEGY